MQRGRRVQGQGGGGTVRVPSSGRAVEEEEEAQEGLSRLGGGIMTNTWRVIYGMYTQVHTLFSELLLLWSVLLD
jgi:hypothetical protein